MQAEHAYQFLEDLLTLCDDPYALYVCADPPIRQLLNRAAITRFRIMDEDLHTAELTPEFAAVQDQVRQCRVSQAEAEKPAVEVPAPRSETDCRRPRETAQVRPVRCPLAVVRVARWRSRDLPDMT